MAEPARAGASDRVVEQEGGRRAAPRRGCGGLHRVHPPDRIGDPERIYSLSPLSSGGSKRSRAARRSGGGGAPRAPKPCRSRPLAQSRQRGARVSPHRRGRPRQGWYDHNNS
eukprot:4717512-Pleurochrysis_carterae.AAC.1